MHVHVITHVDYFRIYIQVTVHSLKVQEVLLWCQERVEQNDLELSDVVFSDESSVQLESHQKTCYHKIGQASRLCGKPKHSPKYMFGEELQLEVQHRWSSLLEF